MRIDTAMIRLLALVLVTWLWLGPGAPPPAHAAMEDGALTLKKAGKAPRFAVWAQKYPESGNLDRVQIVKGWTNPHSG